MMTSILEVQRPRRSLARRAVALLLLGTLCLGSAAGCTERIADFTAISTKNIYAKGIDVSTLPKAEGVKGRDVTFLGIGADLKDAIDRALEKGDGNLMIDCAAYVWWAPFVSGYEVRGTVVKVPYKKGNTLSQDSGS